MQRNFALVSAIAGAIVGVVKVAGLLTGSKWLDANWLDLVAFYGMLWPLLLLMAAPYPQFAGASRKVRVAIVVFWICVLWFLFQLADEYLLGEGTAPVFLIVCGAILLGMSLAVGAGMARDAHARAKAARTKCLYCRETIHVQATRCKHCHGDLLSYYRALSDSLDAAPRPLHVFFRDDDAGWADERLLELVERFAVHGLPLDLAVIPAELDEPLAAKLLATHAGLHQHGYAHTNHQAAGRKCEFGHARTRDEQREDIVRGQERLRELLGDRLDPFFTPPWNRCTRETGEVLVELGLVLLSREHKAEPLGLLPELPVHLDVARLEPEELDKRFAALVREDAGPIGVMFHHGVMEPDAMAHADHLLGLLAGHPNVVPRTMASLCP